MTSAADRTVSIPGLGNARDLGGLPLEGGGETPRGRVLRSARPDALDADGWRALAALGVTTVVDLRRDDEGDRSHAPHGVARLVVAVEDHEDAEYFREWQSAGGPPQHYARAAERWAPRVAAALDAIADAPGAVLVHCTAGRDRTGLVTSLVLDAAGVRRDAVLADYEAGLRGFNALLPRPDHADERRKPDEELAELLPPRLEALDAFLDGEIPAAVSAAAARAAARLA